MMSISAQPEAKTLSVGPPCVSSGSCWEWVAQAVMSKAVMRRAMLRRSIKGPPVLTAGCNPGATAGSPATPLPDRGVAGDWLGQGYCGKDSIEADARACGLGVQVPATQRGGETVA